MPKAVRATVGAGQTAGTTHSLVVDTNEHVCGFQGPNPHSASHKEHLRATNACMPDRMKRVPQISARE